MNPLLNKLQSYPFEKLAQLKQGVIARQDKSHIALFIGEPRHPTPGFIGEALIAHLGGLACYPVSRGIPELRSTIASWLARRFALPSTAIDPERHILPVNGTREALFSFAQCVIDATTKPLVLMPNPFYQIYEGATLLAGAEPGFLNATRETGYLPDFAAVPERLWARCQLLYLCSPANPTGAVLDAAAHARLLTLADRFGFIIASDECYSELYVDESAPPQGLLQTAYAMGNTDFEHCLVFHSLSKRSNAPGLRSGFVAGDARLLKNYLLYRTYHGCTLSLPVQHASVAAWRDETHVEANRASYRHKFKAVHAALHSVLDVEIPPAGFYLWPHTPLGDIEFTRRLYAEQNVTVLPGSFLSRDSAGINPGRNHVRMALVAPLEECVEAAERIKEFVQSL